MKAPGRNYLLAAGVLCFAAVAYFFVTTGWPLWQMIAESERVYGTREVWRQPDVVLFTYLSIASIAWTLTAGICFARFSNSMEKSGMVMKLSVGAFVVVVMNLFFGIASGASMSFLSAIMALTLPALALIGARKNKNAQFEQETDKRIKQEVLDNYNRRQEGYRYDEERERAGWINFR